MVQYDINHKRNLALSLRRGGYSYTEIQKMVPVPKSTLSSWFKDVKLSEPQMDRLNKKRSEAITRASKIRSDNVAKAVEKVAASAAADVKEISKRELWLMGVALYWRERLSERDVRKGVKFTSSDPFLIKLFLKWLKEVGGLEDTDIMFDLFMEASKKKELRTVIGYWSNITGFPYEAFNHVYFQKNRVKKKQRVVKKAEFGLLRIRVRASSMLARQMVGWIKGIQEKL